MRPEKIAPWFIALLSFAGAIVVAIMLVAGSAKFAEIKKDQENVKPPSEIFPAEVDGSNQP